VPGGPASVARGSSWQRQTWVVIPAGAHSARAGRSRRDGRRLAAPERHGGWRRWGPGQDSRAERRGRVGGEKGTTGTEFLQSSTPWYIRRLTNEYSGLRSSVTGFGTEEYNSVIFLGTKEYNKIEEGTLFSYSDETDLIDYPL
jgi:hypothetical protein